MARLPMQSEYLGTAIDFAAPVGEPALLAPDSVQWRIYKNPIALGIGGIAAVLLEFAEPRIRSGVWDHSTYKADPIGRSRRTGSTSRQRRTRRSSCSASRAARTSGWAAGRSRATSSA